MSNPITLPTNLSGAAAQSIRNIIANDTPDPPPEQKFVQGDVLQARDDTDSMYLVAARDSTLYAVGLSYGRIVGDDFTPVRSGASRRQLGLRSDYIKVGTVRDLVFRPGEGR